MCGKVEEEVDGGGMRCGRVLREQATVEVVVVWVGGGWVTWVVMWMVEVEKRREGGEGRRTRWRWWR